MASFDTSKIVADIKARKITSKEPPKYIFESNNRGRKVKKLNPRWTAWSKSQKKNKIKKDVDKYVADRKRPINKDLTIDNSKKNKKKEKPFENKVTGGGESKIPKYKQVTQKELDAKIAEKKKPEAKKDSLKIKKGSARNFIRYKGKMYRRGTPMAKRAEKAEKARKKLGAKGYMKR
tara:strand:+ start:90 stop:620 length:531 start_codon:yes stop_codon:yes gene_type:complete